MDATQEKRLVVIVARYFSLAKTTTIKHGVWGENKLPGTTQMSSLLNWKNRNSAQEPTWSLPKTWKKLLCRCEGPDQRDNLRRRCQRNILSPKTVSVVCYRPATPHYAWLWKTETNYEHSSDANQQCFANRNLTISTSTEFRFYTRFTFDMRTLRKKIFTSKLSLLFQ